VIRALLIAVSLTLGLAPTAQADRLKDITTVAAHHELLYLARFPPRSIHRDYG
jgi:hypothetical protein